MDWIKNLLEAEWFHGVMLLVGAVIAISSVLTARVIARKKQTVDALFASRNDQTLQAGIKCIATLYDASDSNLQTYAKKESKDTEQAKSIRYVLNHWEYVSIGLQHGIFDEAMYKKASYTTMTNLHTKAHSFIQKVREIEGKDTLFQEFDWLAARWKAKPLKKRS